MGFYQPNEALSRFLVSAQQEFKVPIRWAGALSPLGHSLAHLPVTGLAVLWHWAGGLCPTVDGHSLVSPLVPPRFLCLGSCSVCFLLRRCLCSTALSCHSLLLCNACMKPITVWQDYVSPVLPNPSQPCCRLVPLDTCFPKPSLFPSWLVGIFRSMQPWARVVASITSETRSCQVVLRPSLSSTQMCAQSSPYRRCWSFISSMGTCTALSFWVPQ